MSKSRGSARRGRSIFILAALAITCGAVFLGSAGTASAGNLITCGGKVAATGKNANTDAKYFVVCSEDIRGFSVISTAKFDFFGSETDVTPTLSQSATLQCEGSVPGYGFGCGQPEHSCQLRHHAVAAEVRVASQRRQHDLRRRQFRQEPVPDEQAEAVRNGGQRAVRNVGEHGSPTGSGYEHDGRLRLTAVPPEADRLHRKEVRQDRQGRLEGQEVEAAQRRISHCHENGRS